ncbi:MAG TPA: ABC transporter ATP-binding protein [Treponemataceae bacterium]|jgi:NitT/TauT family transport system ATP-binding protein|nr:ABC transporter ATP-binding protein [Treponemataceae bacterium]
MFKSCLLACTIHVTDISLTRSGKSLYESFDYVFKGGKITSILGPSGCGKTSLLHIISSLLKPQSGSVNLSCSVEKNHSVMDIKPSYLFQEHRLLPWHTAEKNISLILEGRQTLDGTLVYDKKTASLTALDYLDKVGLGGYANRYPSQLSGGERQRVSLARAFAFPSPVLLMDEAFQSQDIHLKLQLMDLLYKLHEESPRTVVMVTHDIREALSLSSHVLVLSGSPLVKRLDQDVPSKGLPSNTYIQFPKVLHDLECIILQILASINECPLYPV